MDYYAICWGKSISPIDFHKYLGKGERREAARRADKVIAEERPRYAELLRNGDVVAVYTYGSWRECSR